MFSSSQMPVCGNRLLSALPASEFRKLTEHLEPVKLKRGETVYYPDEPIRYVYFPENCIISQLTVFSDGSSIESGIVGSEGMAGVSVALSQTKSNREAFVQTTGRSFRMGAEQFRRALENRELYELVLGYSSAFYEQVAQAGACSNHHTASQRLARLLLMLHDRVEGDRFFITHDFIAQMLGIHRPSVTLAALDFKNRGLIDYTRGAMVVTDRVGLEAEACECYYLIQKNYSSYNELVELRYLAHRMEQVNEMLAGEMRRRRELRSAANAQVDRLQRTILSSKAARDPYAICDACHHIRDEHGDWLSTEDFLRSYLKTTINHRLCPSCAPRK